MRKITKFKLQPKLYNIIQNLVSNRTMSFKIDGVRSSLITADSGVPQGCLISPFLFNIFLNDMFDLPLSSKIIAYADDIKLLGSDPITPEADLEKVFDWCVCNSMILITESR